MSNRMSIAIAILISVVWTVSTIFDAVNKTYDPRPELGPLMLAVAAFAFANGTLGKRFERKDDG